MPDIEYLKKLLSKYKTNDSLSVYPKIKSNLPIFHITNPPYLYIWYIKNMKRQNIT